MGRTAAALVIGNEILSGKVQDTNSRSLAIALRGLGIEFQRIVVVSDDVALIASEVNALRHQHDLLFTSGGVGPTHDDVTVEGIARALGRSVVRSSEMESRLRTHYGERLTEGHLRMADVVEGTELYPGSDARWPTMVLGNIFVLPGVPQIFLYKLEGLLPRLRGTEIPYTTRSVYTSADEGPIKPALDRTVANYPAVSIGSYPRWNDSDHHVRVTFDSRDEALSLAASEAFAALLPPATFIRAE
jgi:molybdenum cofactor synthesis domain-containing protein